MKKWSIPILSSLFFWASAPANSPSSPGSNKILPTSIHQFTVLDIDGRPVSLSKFKGKVVLIVNVASKCGFTQQYGDLQKLYTQLSPKGFVILGFPSNDFLWQEPGTNDEIKSFCSTKYNVNFPLFDKTHVKGKQIAPLFKFLTNSKYQPERFAEPVAWNFNKFLIDKEGRLIERFGSRQAPLDPEVLEKIQKALNK